MLLVVGPGMDDIERMKALLDYRTAVGGLALLVFAVVGLFWLLMRAKDAHLRTALKLEPLAIQMTTAVQHMTTAVETNSRLIERYLPRPAEEPPRDAGAA